jgi:hypothetical protein
MRKSRTQSQTPAKLARGSQSQTPAKLAPAPAREVAASSGGLLVLVELGGEWPSPVSTDGLLRRVLAQNEGETPAAFADRVANSLDGLFGKGVRLEAATLACNERLDPAAETARRKILGLALGSMAKHKAGRVYLAASARSGGRLRHGLSALAQGLFDEWRTAGLEVSVDFGDASRTATPAPTFLFTARVA